MVVSSNVVGITAESLWAGKPTYARANQIPEKVS